MFVIVGLSPNREPPARVPYEKQYLIVFLPSCAFLQERGVSPIAMGDKGSALNPQAFAKA